MSRCAKCGVELLADHLGSSCPACLLEVGLAGFAGENTPDPDRALDGDPVSPASHQEGLMRQFGAYELLSEIARGGQGVVYRARHAGLKRQVALKMIALGPWATEAHVKRFRTEAEAAANLDHPRIVPIYEIGEVDGQHYFTMKLIQGKSLEQLLEEGPLPPDRAAEIVAEVARAIHHAHERGILHRDIKPGNILIDPDGRTHVTDFGLAKIVEAESALSHTLDVLGTPAYMAPEQASGGSRELTGAADVYSLGAVLYELLTNVPPFVAATPFETIRQVLTVEPRRPALLNPEVDRDLETICLKCLDKEPPGRYESAVALAEDLERWLRREPVRARPSGVLERARKWIRRHPGATASAAAAAGAAAIPLILSYQLLRPAGRAFPRSQPLAILIQPADPGSASSSRVFSRNLTSLMSRLSGLQVTPRGRVWKWEDSDEPPAAIGKKLGVRTLLHGKVRQQGEQLSVSVELVDSSTGARRWSGTWTRPLQDWGSLPLQVAGGVVPQLGVELNERDRSLLRRPPSSNQQAWLHHLRARRHLEQLSYPALLEAVREFERAIDADPQFVHAYAGLAEAHAALGYAFENPARHFERARASLRKALELDPALPEARVIQGALRLFYDWDWSGARRELEVALELDPALVENFSCYLHCLDSSGRADEAIRLVERALALQPNSVAMQLELACAAYYSGRLDLAEAFAREGIANSPDNSFARWGLGRTLAQLERYPEALDALRTASRKPGGEWSGILAEIGYVYARQGRRGDARRVLERLRRREGQGEFVDPFLYAMIHAGSGELDAAFSRLDEAFRLKSPFVTTFVVDPKFRPLQGDPRYAELRRRLNLPPAPSASP